MKFRVGGGHIESDGGEWVHEGVGGPRWERVGRIMRGWQVHGGIGGTQELKLYPLHISIVY